MLRRVPRLVRKRGRVHIPQQEGNEMQSLLLEDGRDGLGHENKQSAPTTMEGLTESLKELKLFPKLEHRRRHLNQVGGTRKCGCCDLNLTCTFFSETFCARNHSLPPLFLQSQAFLGVPTGILTVVWFACNRCHVLPS